MIKSLLLELLPHAPQMGLYAEPHLPADKVRNALGDYARDLHQEEVLALYDATLLGNAKDGAVLTADRIVFQNNNLEAAQTVKYADIVAVDNKRKLLGGRRVTLQVNRGRATIPLSIDFSGKPDAATYVERFLHEAMIHGAAAEMDREETADVTATGSNRAEVRRVLDDLKTSGSLSEADHRSMTDLLGQL